MLAILLSSCGNPSSTDAVNAANQTTAIQISPSSLDPGDRVTFTGPIPGATEIRVCEKPLTNLVFRRGSGDTTTWSLAENTRANETFTAARGLLAGDLTPGASCNVVITQDGRPITDLQIPKLVLNPSVPAKVNSVVVTDGFQKSTIGFDPPAAHGTPLTDYEIQLQPSGTWVPLGTTALPLDVTNLENGRVYFARIRAINILGAGPASDLVRLTPYGPTVAAGQNHTLATTTSGILWGWGGQLYGILGDGASDGTTSEPSTDTQTVASAVPTFTRLVTRGTMSFGLDTQGNAWAWGNAYEGRLGVDPTSDTTRPLKIQFNDLPETKTIVDIASGNAHGLAVDSGGGVWGWGLTSFYQLAQPGVSVSTPTPIAIPGLADGAMIVDVTASNETSFALDSNGHVWAWGNVGTNLFAGTSSSVEQTPIQLDVTDASGPVRSIDAGLGHVLAIDADGHVWGWGDNTHDQLARAPGSATVPAQKVNFGDGNATTAGAPEGRTVVKVAAGGSHSVVLDSEGDVWTAGNNTSGQRGTSSTGMFFTRVDLQSTSLVGTVADIAAGPAHTVVIDAAGNAVAWGDNRSAQLGMGTISYSNTNQPQNVEDPF